MSTDLTRPFGNTGLQVSALGFGAGHIGGHELAEKEAGILLNQVLDEGITLLDTARGYGLSEERIGRHLAGRRGEFALSTKVGYGIPGFQDWTGPIIAAGVSAALERLQTDRIDIVHLHSCPKETLEKGDVITALEQEVKAGRVRVAAYSGDNEHLEYAIATGRFRSIQCSVNMADQRPIERGVNSAAERGMGVIAKRPIANAPWRFAERPVGNYCETYWDRLKKMGLEPRGMDWLDYALRFTAFLPGVSSAIVGTRNMDHLKASIAAVRKGPLPDSIVAETREAFRSQDRNWMSHT